MSNIPEQIISSEEISDLSTNKQTNTNNIKNISAKKKINLNTKNNISIKNQQNETPILLKSKKDIEPNDTGKIKIENNPIKKIKIKKGLNNNNFQDNSNKIIEQYLMEIQRLQNTIKKKDKEINELKIKLDNNNKSKNINQKCFYLLDSGGMGLQILGEKMYNKNKNVEDTTKRIYKIQSLDKMEIFNENINYNIIIETRDSIEILPTQKTPLKGQKTIQMQIDPLEKINYMQILDQLAILNNNNETVKNSNIEMEERDSIEILPTQKTPLKAQKINDMYIERLKIPELFIQNIDHMSIIEGTKKEKNINKIETRDTIKILSLEVKPLQMQHVQKMSIKKYDLSENFGKNRKTENNQEILSTPRAKISTRIMNSIEHIPIKKSPLQMKNAEDLRNKYIKKFKSERKDANNAVDIKKDKSRIENIEPINSSNIISKRKSNYKTYDYGNNLIKPTLKMQNKNNNRSIKDNNISNHKLREISYTNKKDKYSLVKPKPSIMPMCGTTKNITNEKKRINIKYNIHINNRDNNKVSSYLDSSSIYKNNKIFNKNNNSDLNECQNKKGRNVRIIRTQRYGPSIIEKKFIAHSCEKCNNLNFQKKNYCIRDNFHVINSMKNYEQSP